MPVNIKANGIVEYLGTKDGQRWRTTLSPGDFERAGELLSKYELAEVQAAWTPQVVADFIASIEPEPEPGPPPGPSAEQRVAELEAALLELATKGALTPEQLAKLEAAKERQDGSEGGAANAL